MDKKKKQMNITVYCGASTGNESVYAEAAVALGNWIAENGHTLVYGGGKVGLMGILSNTVLEKGGRVIGIMPQFLQERELAHEGLTQLQVVTTMAERKHAMFEQADAFIALPGGPGTLEEITEMISWARIGQNAHPCILLNTAGFYEPLRNLYDAMVTEGFLTEADRKYTLFSQSLSEIDQFIQTYTPPRPRSY